MVKTGYTGDKGKSGENNRQQHHQLMFQIIEWAKLWTVEGGIKIHTCPAYTLMLPDLVNISESAIHNKRGHPQTVFAQ